MYPTFIGKPRWGAAVGGGCCFNIKARKAKVLLSLSREFSKISAMSCLYLHAADFSILACYSLETHEMGCLASLQVFLLMECPGS